MRILLTINSLSAGGAETFVADLATTLAEQGHTVAIFAYAGILDEKGQTLQKQVTIAGVEFISPGARSVLQKALVPLILARTYCRFRPDVVHSNLQQSDFFVCLARVLWWRRSQIRFVRTLHSIYPIKSLPPIAHKVLSDFFDIHIACSKQVANTYPHLTSMNTITIENGIRIQRLGYDTHAATLRSSLGIPKETCTLINVGSFSHQDGHLIKAQDLMIDALARFPHNNVHLVLVGDGECRRSLEEQARNRGLEQRVHFTGILLDPLTYVQGADIVIMPSRFEGLSISCIEAACLGKPLIVSNIEAFYKFAGPSCVVVEPNDIESLVEGLTFATENLSHLRLAAIDARPRFLNMFDITSVTQQYLQAYQYGRAFTSRTFRQSN